MYLLSCSLILFVSCCGVSADASNSPIKGMVIFPSGRTTTASVKSGSLQVLMKRTSSDPMTYLLGSTATPAPSVGALPGAGVGAVASAAGLAGSGFAWPQDASQPVKITKIQIGNAPTRRFTGNVLLQVCGPKSKLSI